MSIEIGFGSQSLQFCFGHSGPGWEQMYKFSVTRVWYDGYNVVHAENLWAF